MSNQLFQMISLITDGVLFFFVIFYLFTLGRKEKKFDEKEQKLNTEYHQIVENAIARHRKILDDATMESAQIIGAASHQAEQIIAGTQYISQIAKVTIDQAMQKLVVEAQTISTNSQLSLDQSSQKLVVDVQKEAFDTARDLMNTYSTTLKQSSNASVTNFQNIIKQMEIDLQKQIKEFRDTMLPKMESDLEEYKQIRLKQTEVMVNKIIQRASQEILKKSLTLDDHEKLMIESLEKAKMEGVFEKYGAT